MKRLILILTLVLLVGCQSAHDLETDEYTNSAAAQPGVEEATPQDETRIVLDGVELRSEEALSNDYFSNKPYTLVNVWGTFCPPCIQEMPELNEIHTMDHDIQVLGIVADLSSDTGSTFGPAQSIVNEKDVQYANLVPTTSFQNEYLSSIQGLPTSFIVDDQGRVISKLFVGAGTAEEYLEFIDYTMDNLD